MKILLDENLPKKLLFDFGPQHTVFNVKQMGWKGFRNGELLGLAVENGFSVFITLDKHLKYQLNLSKYPITIFLLRASNSKHQTIQPMINKISEQLKTNLKKVLIEII